MSQLTKEGRERTRATMPSRYKRPYYREGFHRLCAEMINSMALDLTGASSRKLSCGQYAGKGAVNNMVRLAQNDLREFHEWPIFIRAAATGFRLPTREEVRKILNMPPENIRKRASKCRYGG